MHKTILTALAAATIFSGGMPVSRAEATTAATPSIVGVASSPQVREAAIICGGNGCNPIQTKAQKRRKFQTLGHG
jgi:hypothetical protein